MLREGPLPKSVVARVGWRWRWWCEHPDDDDIYQHPTVDELHALTLASWGHLLTYDHLLLTPSAEGEPATDVLGDYRVWERQRARAIEDGAASWRDYEHAIHAGIHDEEIERLRRSR